jgi:hypothetical protein
MRQFAVMLTAAAHSILHEKFRDEVSRRGRASP